MFVLFDDELTPATAYDFWALAGVLVFILPIWAIPPIAFFTWVYWRTRDLDDLDAQLREELP